MTLQEKRTYQKIGQVYGVVSIVLVNTVILLIIVELLLSFFHRINTNNSTQIDGRASLQYYTEQSWGEQYWVDFAMRESVYSPYVTWVRADFQSETYNVVNGYRVTPNVMCESEDVYTIFVMGGSTVYGAGSPDWHTLPAYVNEEIARLRNSPVCVINMGVSAYVSTQDRIRLEEHLVRGIVPDLVIFYNGLNDVIASHQNGVAGLHHNLRDISDRFQRTPDTFLENTNIVSRFEYFDYFSSNVDNLRYSNGDNQRLDTDSLATATVSVYLENVRIVNALALTFGFDVYYFWQPSLYTTNKLLSDEERLFNRSERLADLFLATEARMGEQVATYDNVFLLTHIFDEFDDTVFIDSWHVIPPANELVARTIVEMIP